MTVNNTKAELMEQLNKDCKVEKATKEQYQEALNIVVDETRRYEKELQAYVENKKNGVENDPVSVNIITEQDYQGMIMVDPADIAEILLKWDYPLYRTAGRDYDCPDGMWEELSRKLGATVDGFDL